MSVLDGCLIEIHQGITFSPGGHTAYTVCTITLPIFRCSLQKVMAPTYIEQCVINSLLFLVALGYIFIYILIQSLSLAAVFIDIHIYSWSKYSIKCFGSTNKEMCILKNKLLIHLVRADQYTFHFP